MGKIINMFGKTVKSFFNKDRPCNKLAMILIPILILLVAGFTVGVLYFVDYNKSPVLTLSNIDSSKVTETDRSDYDINGQINESKGAELFINEVKVKINSNGSFSYSIKLAEGKNEVEFRLVKNGKEIKSIHTINRNFEKTEESNMSKEIQEEAETDATAQNTTPQNTIVDTPIDETNAEQPTTTPVPQPEAPKPVTTRVEVSNGGLTYTFYAPAGYILTMGAIGSENSNTIIMPEGGVYSFTPPYRDMFIGQTIFGNIRATADGPILSSASSVVE